MNKQTEEWLPSNQLSDTCQLLVETLLLTAGEEATDGAHLTQQAESHAPLKKGRNTGILVMMLIIPPTQTARQKITRLKNAYKFEQFILITSYVHKRGVKMFTTDSF